MFHVKHRAAFAVGALLVTALLATGCTGAVTPPKGWAPPVSTSNSTLLVQSAAGRLTAVKLDGTRIADFELKGATTRDWIGREQQAAAMPLYASPLVDGTNVYIVSYKGEVARLSLDGGAINQKWMTDLKQNVVATPILRDGRLYVTTENGRLAVLNADSGSTVADSRPTTGRVWGSPAAQEDRIYIGTLDSSEILALNTSNGATVWKHTGTGATAADLVIDGSTLMVPSFDRTLHGLDAASGKQTWEFTGDGWFVGKPLLTPDVIYAGTMSGSVYALDRSGHAKWQFRGKGLEFRATPILVGSTLIAVSRNGTFVGLDAATGAEKWTRPTEKAEIDANGVQVENAVYFTTNDYRLLRLDPASGDIQTFNIQPPAAGK